MGGARGEENLIDKFSHGDIRERSQDQQKISGNGGLNIGQISMKALIYATHFPAFERRTFGIGDVLSFEGFVVGPCFQILR